MAPMGKRPAFLGNKTVTCDFCGGDFIGNINTDNTFMCDKCLRWICSAPEKKRIEFYNKFKGQKYKQRLISHFISEEALLHGTETRDNGHSVRVDDNAGFARDCKN